MSVCTPCDKANLVPTCTTNLTIGIVTPNTLVFVYILDITTGRQYRFPTSSDPIAGLVIIDISGISWAPDHTYELYITTQAATNIEERLTITVESTTLTCLAIRFQRVFEDDGGVATYAAQTISLDD